MANATPPRPSGRGSVAARRALPTTHRNRRPSPAIRPGLRCGPTYQRDGRRLWTSLPGHQAGAPLRQLGLDAVGGLGDLPSPAIRPGLRCGTGKIEANAIELGIPPRPSGRGSVAARSQRRAPLGPGSSLPGHQAGAPLRHDVRSCRCGLFAVPLPGHQAGAPLRLQHGHHIFRRDGGPPRPSGRGSVAAFAAIRCTTEHEPPSPAIRPGLRCGQAIGLGIGCWLCPSPAIRPGLRCGRITSSSRSSAPTTLPGHQAGAPLRQLHHPLLLCDRVPPPRPSGRGSVAAPRRHRTRPPHSTALPGHQAGAPLRLPTGMVMAPSW